MLGTGGHRNLFQLLSAAKGGSFITGCDSVLTVAMECFLLCVRVRKKKKKKKYSAIKAKPQILQ